MLLGEGEPDAGPFRPVAVGDLARVLLDAAGSPPGRPALVAVDGRGGGGKSTLAGLLHAAVPASAVVHTDDIAWNHSFFGWHELLADGVLAPLRRGEAVAYRPSGWVTHDRPGAVEVATGLDLVLVEGCGAGRRELAPLLDAVVWVQSDLVESERRALVRDVAEGANGGPEEAKAFWDEWMAEELPFYADQRPWERALVVVAGTFAAGGPSPPPGHVAIADKTVGLR